MIDIFFVINVFFTNTFFVVNIFCDEYRKLFMFSQFSCWLSLSPGSLLFSPFFFWPSQRRKELEMHTSEFLSGPMEPRGAEKPLWKKRRGTFRIKILSTAPGFKLSLTRSRKPQWAPSWTWKLVSTTGTSCQFLVEMQKVGNTGDISLLFF